jgi:hypothetical protein
MDDIIPCASAMVLFMDECGEGAIACGQSKVETPVLAPDSRLDFTYLLGIVLLKY